MNDLTLTLFGAWFFVGPVLLWLQAQEIKRLKVSVQILRGDSTNRLTATTGHNHLARHRCSTGCPGHSPTTTEGAGA